MASSQAFALVRMCCASGYLGPHTVVVPDTDIAAVRPMGGRDGYDRDTDQFGDFRKLVLPLAADEGPSAGQEG
jgi:hypothetical protein